MLLLQGSLLLSRNLCFLLSGRAMKYSFSCRSHVQEDFLIVWKIILIHIRVAQIFENHRAIAIENFKLVFKRKLRNHFHGGLNNRSRANETLL